MSRINIAAMIGVLGGVLLLFGGGDSGGFSPQPVDMLGDCYRADRQSKAGILFEMAGRDFGSDQQQVDWFNSAITEAREQDFQPFIDAVAEAIEADTVEELAELIEVAK